jgi:hypothetical protein
MNPGSNSIAGIVARRLKTVNRRVAAGAAGL